MTLDEAAALVNARTGQHNGMFCPVDGTRVEAIVRPGGVRHSLRLTCTVGMLRGETSHVWSIPASMAIAWAMRTLRIG